MSQKTKIKEEGIETKEIIKIDEKTKKKINIKKIANKAFNSVLFCIFICILLFGKTMLFYYKTFAINTDLEIVTVIGTVCFLMVILCFEMVLPNRARIVVTILVDILLSIVMFCDNVYYSYSSNYISIAQISNLQYGEEIAKALPTLIKLYQIVYFIDIIAILILIANKILKLDKKISNKKGIKNLILKIILKIAGILIGIVFAVYVAINCISKGSDIEWSKDSQMRDVTLIGYHIFDIINVINTKSNTQYKTFDEVMDAYEELESDYEEEFGDILYDLQGVLEGKNVIIIQLESVQEFVVNLEINGTEVTPNLNKFLSENIEFTNMHMHSYSTTADTEHTVITSLYPVENGMAFSKYYTNTYDDIFKIFKSASYYTSYMHGNEASFWNRGNLYGRLSVDDLSLLDNFEDTSEKINGFLSDELLYNQAIQKIENYEEPFISYIVAASSHTPFTLSGLQDKSKVTVDVGKYEGTTFGNYLEAVNYADYAFGIFIEELKEAGLYEDTAILVFGDHNGLGMYDDSLLEYLYDEMGEENVTDTYIKYLYTRTLCGFKIPGVESTQITKMVSKLDIKPTLAWLCNLEDGVSLGTNMFASKDFVCVSNGRIISEEYYFEEYWRYVSTGEEVDMDSLDEETKDMLNRYYEYMVKEINISNSIVINNLLANE